MIGVVEIYITDMSYTISQLKTDLTGRLHGTTLNKVSGINALISSAARKVLLDCDPAETRRVTQFSIYDGLLDYAAVADLKRNKIIDIRPITDRLISDNPSQTSGKNFDLYKNVQPTLYTVEHRDGVKIIRINKSLTTGITITPVTSLTGSETWTGDVRIQNLAVDTINSIDGSSIRFDFNQSAGIAGFPLLLGLSSTGTTGTITCALATPLDLSLHEDNSDIFVWMYFDDASIITSVQMNWGSDSSNYWSKTGTTAHTGAFVNGWNLLRFAWTGATQVSNPLATAVDYVSFTYTMTTSASGIHIDNIQSLLGTKYEMVYYSKYLFRSSAGVWKENADAETDIINLDTDSYNLLLQQCEFLALRQFKDQGMDVDILTSQKGYEKDLATYEGDWASERDKSKKPYYRMPTPRR